MDINKSYISDNLLSLAIDSVKKMDEEKTPYDKLKCVSSAYKIINNTIKFCTGKDSDSGADEINPILIYIILKSQPKRMISNIK